MARSRPADQPGGGSEDATSDGTGTGRQLTPSFATLQFDQSPGEAVLAVRVQQPNVVAEVSWQRVLGCDQRAVVQNAAGPRGEETVGTDGSQCHGACHAVACSEGCHKWTHLSCNSRPSAFIAGSCRVSASRTPFPFCLQVDAGRLFIDQELHCMHIIDPCNSASTSPEYSSCDE